MTLFGYIENFGVSLTSTELEQVRRIVNKELEIENAALEAEVDRLRKLGMRATKAKR